MPSSALDGATSMTKTILTTIVALFLAAGAHSQQLKPSEIIYSRMPTDVFAPPTGANSPTIWIVGQDGSNDRFITNGTMPRISDDGRFLLFKRFLIPSSFNPFGIYPEFFVRELSSGQETRIIPPSFDEPSTSHFFSPASNQGNYEIVYDCGEFMCKVNRDGTNRFRFPWLNVEYSYDNFPAIRRGGDQLIAFSNNIITPNVGGLYTVNIDGTNRQKIPNTDCRDFNPAWSNDNQFIAFGTIYTACSNNYPSLGTYPYWISNLFKISPDGSARQQLTNFPLGTDCKQQNANCLTLGYVWTENNSKIIAAGRINGAKGLFAFNTDGSGSFLQIPISAGNAPDFVGGTVQTRIDQDVIAAGNGVTTGDNYTLVSTIGEPVAGLTSAGDVYSFESGFWAIPPDAVGSVTATPTSSATATVTPTLTPTLTPTATPNYAISGTITYGNAIGNPAPPRFISNVTLTGNGSPTVTTTTGAPGILAGQYSLTGFGSGSYTVTPSKTGGTNGAITSFDAARIAQHASGPPNPQLTGNQLIAADVSGNGIVSSFDAAQVAKYAAGPPFEPPGIGLSASWKFFPVTRTYASISGDIAGENYVGLLMGEVTGNWTNTGARPSTRGPERDAVVKLPDIVAAVDKEILVPVTVENVANKNVISYEFNLRYDPSVIQPPSEPVEVKRTVSHGLLVVTNSIEAGLLRVVVYGAMPINEDGVLLVLRFTPVGSVGSVSPLAFEKQVFNEDEFPVTAARGNVRLF